MSWLLVLACAAVARSQPTQGGPRRVFILAGQSNMEGYGLVSTTEGCFPFQGGTKCLNYTLDYTLAALVDSGAHEYQHLRNSTGHWAVRNDVYVEIDGYTTFASPLTVGLGVDAGNNNPQGGAHPDSILFGPELQFGHAVGQHIQQDVLLLKVAFAGTSL